MYFREETAVESAVFSFLEAVGASIEPSRSLVVAFSGGPDSTALLWAVRRCCQDLVQRERETPLRVVAAHLDHGLDARSRQRADAATGIARRLGLAERDIHCHRLDPPTASERLSAGGTEAWARQRRYAFLREVARTVDAAIVLTAHHADDQAETVALRLLYGSGLRGLAGIRPRRDLGAPMAPRVMLVRPLLDLRRSDIECALDAARCELPDLQPLDDPTNADPDQPRSRMRHGVLPLLRRRQPELDATLCRVAVAARCLGDRLESWFDAWFGPVTVPNARSPGVSDFAFLAPPGVSAGASAGASAGVSIGLDAFLALPPVLQKQALAILHARAGRPYPAAESAMAELDRQLHTRRTTGDDPRDAIDVGADCGDGMRWCVVVRGGEERLQVEERSPQRPFTYTFQAPGAVQVPEIFLSLSCQPDEFRPWMLRGEVLRAGLALPLGAPPLAEVRSRRAGDRLRPLGAGGTRKLKDVLIDRQVPRSVRDRLPLLFLDGILAWVPGVTVDETFRLDVGVSNRRVWVAEIHPWPADEAPATE